MTVRSSRDNIVGVDRCLAFSSGFLDVLSVEVLGPVIVVLELSTFEFLLDEGLCVDLVVGLS